MPRSAVLAVAAVLLLLAAPVPAFAYLDPGTGSYVFQAVITIVLTAAFVVKSYWHRLRDTFLRRRHGDKEGRRAD